MRSLAATMLMTTLSSVVAADGEPWAFEKPLVSPSRSFTIVQQRDSDWSTTVHFQHIHAPDIKFSESYPWPALF